MKALHAWGTLRRPYRPARFLHQIDDPLLTTAPQRGFHGGYSTSSYRWYISQPLCSSHYRRWPHASVQSDFPTVSDTVQNTDADTKPPLPLSSRPASTGYFATIGLPGALDMLGQRIHQDLAWPKLLSWAYPWTRSFPSYGWMPPINVNFALAILAIPLTACWCTAYAQGWKAGTHFSNPIWSPLASCSLLRSAGFLCSRSTTQTGRLPSMPGKPRDARHNIIIP